MISFLSPCAHPGYPVENGLKRKGEAQVICETVAVIEERDGGVGPGGKVGGSGAGLDWDICTSISVV